MSTLGERIKFAREQKGLLQSDLAKLINVKSSGVISNWEKDINKPDAEKIVRLCGVLDVSASYLLDYYGKPSVELNPSNLEFLKKYNELDDYGKDLVSTVLEMEFKRSTNASNNLVQVPVIVETPLSPSYNIIPFYRLQASAGNGIYQLGDTVVDYLYLKKSSLTDRATYVIKVSGESMAPDYHDDDMVLVAQMEPVNIGDVGIFVKNGDTYIKERGENELISHNPDFPNVPICETDYVVCLGRVLGVLPIESVVKKK